MTPTTIIALVVGGLAAVVLLSWCAEKRRTDRLRALAATLGFQFTARDNGSFYGSMGGFNLVCKGRRQTLSNILSGTANGIDLTIGDYRYTTGSGKNTHTWSQTLILFRTARLNVPDFDLRPENLFDKIGSVFGFDDVDFPSNPAFSRSYLLKGSDEAALRGIFTPTVLTWFERHSGLCCEGNADGLILYHSGRRVPADKIQSFLQDGFELFTLLRQA